MNLLKLALIILVIITAVLSSSFISQQKVNYENIPEPNFWLEGNAGSWGHGNPFYETQTIFRKKLISYLNTNPSSLSQLEIIFSPQKTDIHEHIQSLVDAQMIKIIKTNNGENIYAPTFAILSTSDYSLIGPYMLNIAQNYSEKINQKKAQLDSILMNAGLDSTYRLLVFLALVRDKFFYEYMDENNFFPKDNGLCPKNGEGNFYGAEPYEPLNSKMIYGITHTMKNNISILYIQDFFKSDSLFESWGFKEVWEAKHIFADIINFLDYENPKTNMEIESKFKNRTIHNHISSILSYFELQHVIIKMNKGYIKNCIKLNDDTINDLRALAKDASQIIAEFISSEKFSILYKKTTICKNNISILEFREAVAWQIIWATPGLLAEKSFFTKKQMQSPELYVFEKEKTIIQKILEFLYLK